MPLLIMPGKIQHLFYSSYFYFSLVLNDQSNLL